MSLKVIPKGPGQSKGELVLGPIASSRLIFPCALGMSGIRRDKREGDHATPAGIFSLRKIFYRPDRVDRPQSLLPCQALTSDMGWCDAPDSPFYNQLIRFPFSASAEHLWRDDGLYDVFAVIGYNDSPVQKGRGSAIFMHVAEKNFAPTEGCVALRQADLLQILSHCKTTQRISIAV